MQNRVFVKILGLRPLFCRVHINSILSFIIIIKNLQKVGFGRLRRGLGLEGFRFRGIGSRFIEA